MAKEVMVLCDGCGRDITFAKVAMPPAFRLHLRAEALPQLNTPVLLVLVQPPIKEDKYFCNFSCLAGWLERKMGHKEE